MRYRVVNIVVSWNKVSIGAGDPEILDWIVQQVGTQVPGVEAIGENSELASGGRYWCWLLNTKEHDLAIGNWLVGELCRLPLE